MTGQGEPARTEPLPRPRTGGWRGAAWALCGVAASVAIVWYLVAAPGRTGSKAEWFFGSAVLCVVLVSLWQTVTVQRQANLNAATTNERAARELAHVQALHRAELQAQRELARIERAHLLAQLQRQAMIEVSRSVGAQTQMLATLWNSSANILMLDDRDERERAMRPIFEQISQTVNDFSVELANAHLLVDDERLHDALNRVNEAALTAIKVAEELHTAVVEGQAPQSNPVAPAALQLHARAAEARRLSWDLLRSGLNGVAAQPNSGSTGAG